MQGRLERRARLARRADADADDRSGGSLGAHAVRDLEQRAARRLEQHRVHVLAFAQHGLVADVLHDVHNQVTHVGVILEDQDSGHTFIIGDRLGWPGRGLV